MKMALQQNSFPTRRRDKASLEIIAKARADGRNALTEIEAKQVFSAYGLPVTSTSLAKTEDEAVIFGQKGRVPGGNEDRLARDPAQIGCRRRESQRKR